jgi:hypothetical protein
VVIDPPVPYSKQELKPRIALMGTDKKEESAFLLSVLIRAIRGQNAFSFLFPAEI